MYTLSEIKEMISMLDQSSVQELEIEKEGFRVLIRKSNQVEVISNGTAPIPVNYPPMTQGSDLSAPAYAAGSAANDANASGSAIASGLHQIVSPMVGTFYKASSPEAPSYVQVGDRVSEKAVVCIIEAMKLMNEIEAEVTGEIVEILVENGQLVEYGQPLFLVRQG